MIQRIQSIYLLLAALSLLLGFVFPLFKGLTAANGFFVDSIYDIGDHPALLGLTVGTAIIAVVAVFLFKQRSTQQKLAYFGLSLSMVLLAAIIILGIQDTPGLFQKADVFVGSVLPLIAIIFMTLSVRAISKDEEIVKSMDRLR